MRWAALAVLALAVGPAYGADVAPKSRDWFVETGSIGFSYPLVVSASGGVLLPLGKTDPAADIYLGVPALRLDVEAGAGGGDVAAGAFIPFGGGSFALNVKAARLRTWLAPWNQPKDHGYDGAVVELVVFGHIPGKIGVGRFRDRDGSGQRFTSFFFGLGW
jgi:hypothetical protein